MFRLRVSQSGQRIRRLGNRRTRTTQPENSISPAPLAEFILKDDTLLCFLQLPLSRICSGQGLQRAKSPEPKDQSWHGFVAKWVVTRFFNWKNAYKYKQLDSRWPEPTCGMDWVKNKVHKDPLSLVHINPIPKLHWTKIIQNNPK